ncbi:hypothetical protein NIIDMKKI_72820 [Mycobacterium kansasii]|uniref:PE family protein n=1 Tax=Mycobacterium kansasii TaxID=1768 RepID=A0A7G1IM48_MYCKA|nr:hypothetical protein NIIDMKKI_72820 [Mycobacterium kansasii]
MNAFAGDIGAMLPTSLPDFSLPAAALTGGSPTAWALPTLPAPTGSPIDGIIDTLKAANTHITNAISSAAADTYAMALPTADIVNTLATKVPSYNVNLFLDGIQELANGDPAGLVNAFGYPVAADVALLTLAGGFQTIVLLNGVESVIGDLTGAA